MLSTYRDPKTNLFLFSPRYRAPVPASYCAYAKNLRRAYNFSLRLAYPELNLRALVYDTDSIAILESEILAACRSFISMYHKYPMRLCISDTSLMSDPLKNYMIERRNKQRPDMPINNGRLRDYFVRLYKEWSQPLIRAHYRLPNVIDLSLIDLGSIQNHLLTLAYYYQTAWNSTLQSPLVALTEADAPFLNEDLLAYLITSNLLLNTSADGLIIPVARNTRGEVIQLPFAKRIF
jgi:hypothetical protein